MMECLRTERIEVGFNTNLSQLCHQTKNLYNVANYTIRKLFFKQKTIPTYYKLWKIFKTTPEYKILPGHTAQQTLRTLAKNWTSFIRSNKKYNHNPIKFTSKPSIPRFKKKDGEFQAIFTVNQVNIGRDGHLNFPKKVKFKIKTRLSDKTKLQLVRIIPKGVGYRIEIVYKRSYLTKVPSVKRKAAIDLGVKNIITMVDNIGSIPIVVKDDGKGLKSSIQYYLKERARLQSIYENQSIRTGKKLKKLIEKFEHKKLEQLHKISISIVQECEKKNIGVLIIGYNPEWKQSIQLGRRMNQNFVSIPYFELIEKIKYKSEEKRIQVILVDESYTSKCSFLDNESVKKQLQYQGKRVSRGIFCSSKGFKINADVNAAYNILTKSDPKALPKRSVDGVGGYVAYPSSWKL